MRKHPCTLLDFLPALVRQKIVFQIDFETLSADSVRAVAEMFEEHVLILRRDTVVEAYRHACDLFVRATTLPPFIVVIALDWDHPTETQVSLARTALACIVALDTPFKIVCISQEGPARLRSQLDLPKHRNILFVPATAP